MISMEYVPCTVCSKYISLVRLHVDHVGKKIERARKTSDKK